MLIAMFCQFLVFSLSYLLQKKSLAVEEGGLALIHLKVSEGLSSTPFGHFLTEVPFHFSMVALSHYPY